MAKKQTQKITLEQLIARKTQGELDKLRIKYYNSEELGGQIEIRKVPLSRILEIMDALDQNTTTTESLEFSCQLLFECCPIFNQNSKELCEVYECQDPLLLPAYILNDNMGEINAITEEILSMYGLSDKVKN